MDCFVASLLAMTEWFFPKVTRSEATEDAQPPRASSAAQCRRARRRQAALLAILAMLARFAHCAWLRVAPGRSLTPSARGGLLDVSGRGACPPLAPLGKFDLPCGRRRTRGERGTFISGHASPAYWDYLGTAAAHDFRQSGQYRTWDRGRLTATFSGRFAFSDPSCRAPWLYDAIGDRSTLRPTSR